MVLGWLVQLKELFVAGNEIVVTFNTYLESHFGKGIQLAMDWVIVGLLLVLVLRLFKYSLDTLRYVLVPSVVVSGFLALLTGFSFVFLLPFAMGVGTIFMLFKS